MKSMTFFLLGLGAGAVLGMLYSPNTGSDNRDLLKRKVQDGADYVKRSASEGGDYLNRKTDDLKKSAGDTIERGKGAAIGTVQDVKTAVEAGKQAYGEAVRRSNEEAGG